MKKRILVGGDTSLANSGFAVYKKFLLKGLFDSNLFEVAEVANGGNIEDRGKVPWKYYPTAVRPDDKRYQQYIGSPQNEYGAWRWEKICLDYKPTHICEASDPWQFAHEVTSPLKPYYHLIISPTVDSIPQRIDFMQIYSQVDTLLSYTEWAKDYLNENNLNCLGSIGMGVDPEVMKPLNKIETKKKYHLPEDSIIFGFVARNQMRKRFPDIIESFSLYLKKVPKEIADKSYMYFHTGFLDQGFSLPNHMLEHGVINKIFFTYFCQKTGQIFCSTFKGERCYSPFSNELTAISPNVAHSPTFEQLNEVYNLFDCYIQPATAEGFGFPQIEAAASNIPIIATDYSAMAELSREFGGYPVKPGTLNYEHGVMARRASMDIEAWADAMVKYAQEKPLVNSREVVLQKYTWKHIIDKWIYYIERADMPKVSWNAPIKQYAVPPLQGNMTVTQFIYALSKGVPQLNWSTLNLVSMRSLNNQMELNGKQMFVIKPEMMAKKYETIINNINACEQIRTGQKEMEKEDFLYNRKNN